MVGTGICLVLSATLVSGLWRRAAHPRQPLPAERVNPNEAPAVSLARLPGIGPTRARAIVAFRNRFQAQAKQTPVFRRVEDLSGVSGIGPATIKGIRPWLRFDPPPEENKNPPGP